ncbi:hypothetical protein TSUD_420580, partial [Trifolium subterraneum]
WLLPNAVVADFRLRSRSFVWRRENIILRSSAIVVGSSSTTAVYRVPVGPEDFHSDCDSSSSVVDDDDEDCVVIGSSSSSVRKPLAIDLNFPGPMNFDTEKEIRATELLYLLIFFLLPDYFLVTAPMARQRLTRELRLPLPRLVLRAPIPPSPNENQTPAVFTLFFGKQALVCLLLDQMTRVFDSYALSSVLNRCIRCQSVEIE